MGSLRFPHRSTRNGGFFEFGTSQFFNNPGDFEAPAGAPAGGHVEQITTASGQTKTGYPIVPKNGKLLRFRRNGGTVEYTLVTPGGSKTGSKRAGGFYVSSFASHKRNGKITYSLKGPLKRASEWIFTDLVVHPGIRGRDIVRTPIYIFQKSLQKALHELDQGDDIVTRKELVALVEELLQQLVHDVTYRTPIAPDDNADEFSDDHLADAWDYAISR